MTEPTSQPVPHVPTLMTVHAHPDDEIDRDRRHDGQGRRGQGRRVVLVTCTRGEMGEIVVPEMDTPDNHRRLGEMRAGELERAMDGARRHRVGEPRLPRLRHDGPARATATRAPSGRPTSTRRSAGSSGWSGRYQPDVMTTYNDFGGYGHPDHIRTHARGGRARSRGPATRPGTRSSSRPSTAAPARRPRRAASRRGPRRSSTSRRSRRRCATRCRSGWRPSASARSGARRRTRRRSRSPSSRRSPPGCSSRTRRSRPGSTSPAQLETSAGRRSAST